MLLTWRNEFNFGSSKMNKTDVWVYPSTNVNSNIWITFNIFPSLTLEKSKEKYNFDVKIFSRIPWYWILFPQIKDVFKKWKLSWFWFDVFEFFNNYSALQYKSDKDNNFN
jgi:hypothetical protein